MKQMERCTKMLLIVFLPVVLGLALSSPWYASGEQPPPRDPNVFKIGCISSITGPATWIHMHLSKTVDMAVNEINAAGGIAGIPVELIYEDNKSADPKAALSAMNKLIFMDKIQVVVVTFSASILAANPLAAENKVLQINPGGWSPILLDKPYLFSTRITGDLMTENGVKAAWANGHRKAAILYPNDPAGIYCMKLAEELWKKWGGAIASKETASVGTTNFNVQLVKIKGSNPDVILSYCYGLDGGYLIKQARELALNVPIYGVEWGKEIYKVCGPAAAGFKLILDYWDPEKAGPWAKRFVDSYEKLYGERFIQSFAVNTYEAIYIIKEIIEEARKMGGDYFKGEILKDALLKKRRFKSVYGGDLVFRDNGSCDKTMALLEVQADGSMKVIEVYKPY